MNEQQLVPWEPRESAIVPSSAMTPAAIIEHAQQLTKREVNQIISNFNSGHYEIASTYVWSKAIAGLCKLLSTLGMEFIGEMLQRPDINADSDITTAVTPFETISLAEDLGMVSSTEAMRLRHAYEIINHFTSIGPQDEDEAVMNPEEAISCLRTCVQNILGHPKLAVAQDFAEFRKSLEEQTFDKDDEQMASLSMSPYFYLKTILSVLLALLKTSNGAQLEHAVRNINVILPLLWKKLRKPERWQTGQTYAELYNDGKKPAVTGLKKALLKVSGFDFVPENLRSHTFTATANTVLKAHEGMNNYYNEPAPMKTLASLGTTIPSPAFPVCMTATLSVRLGNPYGFSTAAQSYAQQVMRGLSEERWKYYLDECLLGDRRILLKLLNDKPRNRWTQLVEEFELQPEFVTNRSVKNLLQASLKKDNTRIVRIAKQIYQKLIGR